MRAGIATAFLYLVVACAPSPSPAPSASSVAPAPSSSVPAPSASASPAPASWLPSWADADTPAAVVTRSALPFCGVEQGAGPGITMNAEVRGCFLAAYRAGAGAEFASIQSTIEGDPIATIWRTRSTGGVELLIDATQDEFGAKVWQRTTCRVLVNDQREVFGPDGCDEGAAIP
jgi:hypothetical protein